MDIHALNGHAISISEIACRTNHDRNTLHAYLNSERTPGQREQASPYPFDAFVDYVAARLAEDPHLWAATLLAQEFPLLCRL